MQHGQHGQTFSQNFTWFPNKYLFKGIGGNSAGYFLRENFHKAQILLINKAEANGDPIGGRLATVKVNGRDYEIGGSIIHSTNKYMVDYLEKCDLKKKISAPEASFSLHKDGEIVFQVK